MITETPRDEIALEILKVIVSTEIPASGTNPGAFYDPKLAVDRACLLRQDAIEPSLLNLIIEDFKKQFA